jgi:hypothetical protein
MRAAAHLLLSAQLSATPVPGAGTSDAGAVGGLPSSGDADVTPLEALHLLSKAAAPLQPAHAANDALFRDMLAALAALRVAHAAV